MVICRSIAWAWCAAALLVDACVSVAFGAAMPTLGMARNRDEVTITFSGRLQSAPGALGPYIDVAGARSPYAWHVGALSQRFWRAAAGRSGTIATGPFHSAVISPDGRLWTWGDNYYGQLGVGTNTRSTNLPVRVGSDTNWASVACGIYHTVAIKMDGSLWAWGPTYANQPWGVTPMTRYQPEPIGTDTNWIQVACGNDYTAALRTDGTLWNWGGTVTSPIQIRTDSDWAYLACGASQCAALKVDGTLWFWSYFNGTNRSTPLRVATESNYTSVACGLFHTLALKFDGSLWGWGGNGYGELGISAIPFTNQPTIITPEKDWVAVACGATHSVALKADGSLWAWGENTFGQAALAPEVPMINRPTRVGTDSDWRAIASSGDSTLAEGHWGRTIALKSDGSVWTWGTGLLERQSVAQPAAVSQDTNWTAVTCGDDYTVALKRDGSLWAWGRGIARSNDGVPISVNRPVPFSSDTDWIRVSVGAAHAMAFKVNGTLWGWGANYRGQLGDGTYHDATNILQVSGNWSAVACGRSHTIAIRSDGSLWGWGAGQSGNSTDNSPNWPTRLSSEVGWRALAAGSSQSLAIKTDGSLWSWGHFPVRVGLETDWQSVACGYDHNLAIKSDGSLWAWGTPYETNGPTQIVVGSTWIAATGGYGIMTDGSLWSWGGANARLPVRTGVDDDWAAVSRGANHTVALKTDGTLWAWGRNAEGQAAQPVRWLPGVVPNLTASW